MEQLDPVKVFEALAHETRLSVFWLLIPAERDGMPAGVIGERLGLPANNLSFHLGRLFNAGLIRSRRQGRHLYYAVAYARLSELVGFLANDCCDAVPEGCRPDCPSVLSTTGRGCRPKRSGLGHTIRKRR